MVFFFYAMNLLIFSNNSDNYGLNSVGGFEGLAVENAGVGKLSSPITKGTLLCLGHESGKF